MTLLGKTNLWDWRVNKAPGEVEFGVKRNTIISFMKAVRKTGCQFYGYE
jgi:hypothetical protein